MKTFSTLIVTCWRTYNADRTQKINSDCAEKDSENVPFGEGRKKAQKLKLIRYKSAHNNGDEEDEAEKLWWGNVNGKNRIGWGKIKSNHNSKSTSIKYAILRFIISTWNCVSLIKQFEQFSAEKRWCGKFSFDWSIPLLSAENSLQPAFTLWLSARRWKPYKR